MADTATAAVGAIEPGGTAPAPKTATGPAPAVAPAVAALPSVVMDELKAHLATLVAEGFGALTQPAAPAPLAPVNSQGQTMRQVVVYGLAGLAAIGCAVVWKGDTVATNPAVVGILSTIIGILGAAVSGGIGSKATSMPTGPGSQP